MLISLSRKFLFIHIEKAGGTSIRKHLKRYCRKPILDRGARKLGLPHREWLLRPWSDHATAGEAKSEFPSKVWQSLYKFSFVRNPCDREVSTYFFFRELKRFSPADPRTLAANEFSSFESWFYGWRVNQPVRDQVSYLVDDGGNCLMNYVGYLERFYADWDSIFERIKVNGKPGHENRFNLKEFRPSTDFRTFYSSRLIEDVGERYARDLELLGYRWDSDSLPDQNHFVSHHPS